MVPDSPQSIAFLGSVLLVFAIAKDSWRPTVLLLASLGFYAVVGSPQLVLVLLVVAAVAYLTGLYLARRPGSASARAATIAIVAVASLLVLPKAGAITASGHLLGMVRTLGLSYLTVQAISYIIDVRSGSLEPERSFQRLTLFFAFFPKVVQGPIERGASLLPQLSRPYGFDGEAVRRAALRIGFGLFKKIVVADRLGLYVDPVFGNVQVQSGPVLLAAVYLFAAQLYLDFSAYTDIAVGVARLFGIELSENFDRPYSAESVAEFWRRWHMSFSRWILDYVFRPLQMWWRHGGQVGQAAALLVTFLFSGAWHGLAWTYVAWGALHGTYLAGGVLLKSRRRALARALRLESGPWMRAWRVLQTFHLVLFAWVFFRAATMGDALHVVRSARPGTEGLAAFLLMNGKFQLALAAAATGILAARYIPAFRRDPIGAVLGAPVAARWSVYVGLSLAILLGSTGAAHQTFLYVRF